MSPRGKAKSKEEVEENGREKRVRESRNVKATSYKDLSDSEDEKPKRRRKKESDSESLSEAEKPKKKKGATRKGSAKPKKEESESEEASDFISDESSSEDRKKRKPARKPTRSLRTQQKTSYKDLSDSEEEEEDSDFSSGKKKGASKKKPGRPAKKSKKDESSASESEEEEENEDNDDNEGDEEAEDEVSREASPKKKPGSGKAEGAKVEEEPSEDEEMEEKKTRPEHDLSDEEIVEGVDKKQDNGEKKEKKNTKAEASDTKKRGRPTKSKDEKEESKEEEPQSKKAKVADKPAMNKTETDFDSIDFSSNAKTKDGKEWNLKISSWNVAGLKALIKKNGLDFIKHENPDILCLQETKCSEKKLPPEANVEGYNAYWCSGEKEGYAGVAILSKVKPIDVKYGVGKPEFDSDGRVITAEFEKFFVVNVYVPNAGQGLKTLPRRLEWDPVFRDYLKKLDEKKPVILCGDMNVAHNEIDLTNPKTNVKSAGFTPQEREGMTQLLKEGFVDTYRSLYPDKTGAYSFWTYFNNARARNIGWRLDYFITSERFVPNVCDNLIRTEVYGSDHCPITLLAHV